MDLINNPWFVLVLGMGTVFIGLFLLVIIIKIMGLIAGKNAKKPDVPAAAVKAAPMQAAAPAGAVYPHEVDRYAFDAAVAAAIAVYYGRDVEGFRITKITKM